ncbi:MAG: helix-turn-helix transcriptional regulator [Caldilineaceae bacterium]|nr:helix-turn-helix transcriptional regulator [Caldilineaceae bacterium]
MPNKGQEFLQLKGLGRQIYAKRVAEKLTLQQAAKQAGVSAATLSRLERLARGKGKTDSIPDTKTLNAVANWLNVSIDQVWMSGNGAQASVSPYPRGTSLPDIVEAYLRADRNLEPDDAAALGKMFRTIYQQYSAE